MELTQKLTNKGFMVKPNGDFSLVHPSRGKYDWEADELRFRSVILDAAGPRRLDRLAQVLQPGRVAGA